MGNVISMEKGHGLTEPERRGRHPTAAPVLEAWDRLFGGLDAAAERQERREQRWDRAKIEREAKQRL